MSDLSGMIKRAMSAALLLLCFEGNALANDTPNAQKLLMLAEQRFGTLSAADKKLFRSVAAGEWANYATGDKKKDDPANADQWGNDRTLVAERIRWLCTDKQAMELVTHNGIQVEGARIKGELNLSNIDISFWLEFKDCAFSHAIYLMHASVRGLTLHGSHTGPIYANGIRVTSSVFLRGRFKAEGAVLLQNADIGGNLECDTGQFINPKGYALQADGIRVAGNVFLRSGFRAEGEVRFPEADIGGGLDCRGGQFSSPDGYALDIEGIKITGNVYLRDGFSAVGRISLVFANIGRGLVCTGIDSATNITLDLRSARVGTLWDDTASWPDSGNLYLDGFVYERLDDKAPRDVASRIRWLRRQPADQFYSQPYEQLAEVFRKEGRDKDAGLILIAKNQDPVRISQMGFLNRTGDWIYSYFFGYGYLPTRLLKLSIIFPIGILITFFGFRWGYLISPGLSHPMFNQDAGEFNNPNISTLLFCAILYCVDYLMPPLGQVFGRHWPPIAYDARAPKFFRNWYGKFLAFYMRIHIVLGWISIILIAAGLTKLIRG